jgi:hypothetical protein
MTKWVALAPLLEEAAPAMSPVPKHSEQFADSLAPQISPNLQKPLPSGRGGFTYSCELRSRIGT